MNKEQIINSAWKKAVYLRPIPKLFDAPHGNEIGPIDRAWLIHQVTKENGVHLQMETAGYGIKLNWDNIREFSSDPVRGDRYGFLLLKIQINIGGDSIWVEPFVGMLA